MTKPETINLINSLKLTPTQDAAGGFLHTPIQTIFQMRGGRTGICWTDIAVALKFNENLRTIKNDVAESMVVSLTDYNHPNAILHRFTINAPKSAQNIIPIKPSTSYGKVVSYYFNDFKSANKVFKSLVEGLGLNSDLYLLDRYNELQSGLDKKFGYDEYLKVIKTDVNTL